MRRRLPFLIGLAVLALGAAVALAQVEQAPRARAATVAASGSFEISNSRDGQPIFAATGIAPGGSAHGTVAVEDTGSGPIALRLHRGELVDTPGLEGGLLSERLELTVVDVSAPGAPATVYAGPLASMPDTEAGELQPGEARTYEFTATLPEEGVQNAVQGAATTVAYSWIAAESEGEEEAETPGGGGTQPGGGTPAIPPGGGGVAGNRNESPLLDLVVPKVKRMLRGPRIVVWTNCDMTCRLSVRGRIRASVAGHHRGARIRFAKKRWYAPGPQKLRVPIPHPLRRWLRETEGRKRVRVKLRVIATGVDGQRDVVKKTVRLRVRRH
jgi:hypothetical protein